MAAHGENFCTSVAVLCTTPVSFCWFGFKNIPNYGKSIPDEILLDQFYMIEYLKGFIIAVWIKYYAKSCKDGKLAVKTEEAFVSFLK